MPSFSGDKPFSVVLRGIDSYIRREVSFDPKGIGWPVRWFPSLGIGRYELELRPENGMTLRGRFSVDVLTPTLEPIKVQLN